MKLRNNRRGFGLVAILLHWVAALLAIGLFASGLWMTGLGYYDGWYNRAPDLHRAFGVTLAALLVLRLIWKLFNPAPAPEPGTHAWEHVLAASVQWLMYVLLFAILVTGYLMSTLDGRSVGVFGLFSIPSLLTAGGTAGDLAGDIHYWVSMGLAGLVGLHSTGAIKHHLIDRNRTLVRIIRPVKD